MSSSTKLFVVISLVCASGLLLGVSVAPAAPLTLVNPSFESPLQTADTESQVTPTGWNVGGTNRGLYVANGTVVTSNFGAITDAGSQAMDIGGVDTTPFQLGYLWQNTGIALQPGTMYTLTFAGSPSTTQTVVFDAFLCAAGDVSSEGTPFREQNWLNVAADKTYVSYSVSAVYSGPTGQYLTVEVGAATDGWWSVDNVQLSSAVVPEPSAIVLVASGLIGLLCYAWRKRR
jgi:hypothetical protein